MENKGRNVWMPVAIVAIILAVLLACLLVACSCLAFGLMARSDTDSGSRNYEYLVPAPLPEVTVVPERIGGGATITYVEPGSPADTAGLQRGDVILAVDAASIDANHDLAGIIGDYEPGDAVTIQYRQWRTGQIDETTARLGENPSDGSRPYLGIEYSATPFFDGDFED